METVGTDLETDPAASPFRGRKLGGRKIPFGAGHRYVTAEMVHR